LRPSDSLRVFSLYRCPVPAFCQAIHLDAVKITDGKSAAHIVFILTESL
jgi:hypothetical protein